jgi:hypothetical protein
MADFFKGLAGGFGTGLQFGQAMQAREERERLREAMAMSPQEMQQRQATPEEFGRAQAETQGLAAQDAAEFGLTPLDQPTYAPQMPVQGQRIGASQYGLGGQTFARMPTQQEIQQARYGAMADVIAERDPARAMQMRQQLDEQAYQAKYRPLQLQSLEGQIEGQGLSRQAQRLTISESERKLKQDESNRLAQGKLAELSADGTPIDTATANRIARETGADMTFVTDAVLKQYSLTKASANDLIERQLAEFDKAAKGGLPTLNKYIAERLDPDKTDNIVPTVVQGPDGKLRVMYGDKPLPGYQAYGGIDQLSAAFQGNIKRDPLGAAIQISTLDTQAQARLASQSTIRASDSAIALRNQQMQMLKTQAAGNAEAQKVRAEYEALSPEEQVGAKGQGLIRQFNMANSKAGTPIPLGAAARPQFTPKDYAATIKSFTDAGFSQTDALIRTDQLYGRGPADANVDAGLQKANAEKTAKTPATTTRRGPGDLSTVDIEKIRADAAALDAAITQAQAQASAVVRSGDTTAIRLYGDRLNALRAQRAALTEGLTAPAVQTLGLK